MRITFDGGLNENDGTAINECQEGFNFDLVFGDTNFKPRNPLDLKGTSPNGGEIAGIMQLVKRDDSETTLIFDDDSATPEMFLWDGGSTFTSKRTTNLAIGSKLRSLYYSLDDRMTIVDTMNLTPLMTWDGTTCERHKTGLAAGSPAAVTSITRSGTTATCTTTAVHGFSTGDLVHIADAVEPDYNGEFEITVTSTTVFEYEVANSPTTPATGTITVDFGVEVYAKYGIIHNGRQWLFNIKTNDGTESDTPHLMAASAYEDIESYDTTARNKDGALTGNEAFYMLTRDLKPINGVVLFNKELVISTVDGRLYRLIGHDATNYDWAEYYSGSSAIGTETLVNFGNDVALMRKGGRIDTLRATDASSDVSVDDISRWIPNSTRSLTDAIAVYDNDFQKVYFFVNSKVLVLYKDNLYGSQVSPWSIYRTELDFRFNTSAATRIKRPGTNTYSVYLGGSTGELYDLNGNGDGDAGATNVLTQRKSNLIEELNTKGGMLSGHVNYRRVGQCDLTLSCLWSEDYNTTQSVISLKGRGAADTISPYYAADIYYNGNAYYNGGFIFEGFPTRQNFSPAGKSPSFFFEITTDSLYKFQIDYIELNA